MSLTSAFFDAELVGGVYDRVYSAERFAEYFAAFIANGVFPDPATNLQVVANVPRDMTVLVKSGLGWINGYYCNNDGNYPLTISPASGTLPRVDAVVLRWSRSNRSISLEVKTGVATSSPSAPSLERSADNYELMLASIDVVAGATSIAQANITDKRPDSSVCGWVKGVVDQVDTTNLFAQYDAAFQEWFDNIKSQLSGDIATNLQNQIDRNAANIAVINATTLKEDTKAALGLPTSAGPDDAFKVLAHVGNLHVWERVQTYADPVPEVPAGYTLGAVENEVVLVTGTASTGQIYYDYSSALSVASDGTVSLSGATSTNASMKNLVGKTTFAGKFIQITSGYGTVVESDIFYVPSGAAIGDSISSLTIAQLQRVTGYPYTPSIPAGTTTDYLTSTDRNAYTDGTVDNTTITYLGQLGDKARIEVGSYVGTGTASADIIVGFTPKAVIVSRGAYLGLTAEYSAFILPGLPNETSDVKRAEIIDNGFRVYYSGSTTTYRNAALNYPGSTYRYIAIG